MNLAHILRVQNCCIARRVELRVLINLRQLEGSAIFFCETAAFGTIMVSRKVATFSRAFCSCLLSSASMAGGTITITQEFHPAGKAPRHNINVFGRFNKLFDAV